jgi:hypothetical protein
MTSTHSLVARGPLLAFCFLALLVVGCGDSAHTLGSTGTGASAGATGAAGAGGGGTMGGNPGRGGDAPAGTSGATGGAIGGSGGAVAGSGGAAGSGGRGGTAAGGGGATGGATAGSGGAAGRGGTGGGGGAGGAAGRGGTGGGGGAGGAAGRGGTGGAGGAVCGGSPDIPCAGGLVCDINTPNQCGSGSVTGRCIPLPTGCTADFNPVCGCNGQTYSNDCERANARAQLDHVGACGAATSCASCNVATTYCQVTVGGIPGSTPFYGCLPLPAGCGSTPSCACLASVTCGSQCGAVASGLLTITCAAP